MPLITKQTSRAFSSALENGAQNRSADGSQFSVTLQTPLSVPPGALDAEIGCLSESLWYTTANISADFGNSQFTYRTTFSPPGIFVIDIAQGLYSLSALGQYLSNEFVNRGHPANLIMLSAADASQKTVLTINKPGDGVDFAVAGSVGPLLGFPPVSYTATVASQNFTSPGVAAFNRVDSYLIRSSIVVGGLPVNANTTGVIASIAITVSPGSQIVYEPTNITWVSATDLIGRGRQNIDFALVDQLGRPTPTSETYSIVLMLRWVEWAQR